MVETKRQDVNNKEQKSDSSSTVDIEFTKYFISYCYLLTHTNALEYLELALPQLILFTAEDFLYQ